MIEDCAHDTRTWQRRTSYLQLDNHLGVYGNISNIFKQRAIFLKKKRKKMRRARATHTHTRKHTHTIYIYIYTQGAREQRVSVKIYEESSRVESSGFQRPRRVPLVERDFFSPEKLYYIYIEHECALCG